MGEAEGSLVASRVLRTLREGVGLGSRSYGKGNQENPATSIHFMMPLSIMGVSDIQLSSCGTGASIRGRGVF